MGDLNAFDLDKFLKLIGMLGSDHEGERANAAALATKMLRDHGMTWPEFLATISAPAPVEPLTRPGGAYYQAYNHEDAADTCLQRGRGLTAWEKDFLESVRDFHHLSAKQEDVLARICEKCKVVWP